MGRRSIKIDPNHPPNKLAVNGPVFDAYDQGGAYWGMAIHDIKPLYAVWVRGEAREGVAYVRANTREEAKMEVLGRTWHSFDKRL